ncbi:MAG: hypothetical protein HOP19_14180 [Acidobacteria bacterium]|nr:hypothetical protein [Acidobacteriota bacterium]
MSEVPLDLTTRRIRPRRLDQDDRRRDGTHPRHRRHPDGILTPAQGEAEAVAFFRELPNETYRISLRSKNRVNVARVAEPLRRRRTPQRRRVYATTS